MRNWSSHITAAANLIDVRGSSQFANENAVRMFLQIRRLIVRSSNIFEIKQTDKDQPGYIMLSTARADAISTGEVVSLGRVVSKR
jgi:hypothetical protein